MEFELAYDPRSRSVTEYTPDSGSRLSDEVLIYRFNSALVFFNSGYFIDRLVNRAAAKQDLKLVDIDAEPINYIDLTATTALGELICEFNNRGVRVVFGRANQTLTISLNVQLAELSLATDIFYPTVHAAIEEFGTQIKPAAPKQNYRSTPRFEQVF